MKVLIADKFDASGVEALGAMGCEVVNAPDTGADAMADAVHEHQPDVLIVRGTKVPAPVFEKGKKLALVIRAGAGYDTIDVNAASAQGVFVANCPGKNAIAVAELVWGLILCCDRRIPDQTMDLREGKWNKKEYSKAKGLHGRTLGIVGLGQIGIEVANRGKAFGMRVVVWSRSLTDEKSKSLGVERRPTPIDVAREADVISVNVAANAETKKLINAEFCAAMREGAYFVNTSRGSVVDEDALLKAIREKGVRAGLDVFENEPGQAVASFESVLAKEPGVYGSHHVGASTDQAQGAIADEAVRILRVYMETGEVENVVNRCAKSPATRLLTVRHRNKPGVLAGVFNALSKAEINVEEMENMIYHGAEAACARIRLDAEPAREIVDEIAGSSKHILAVDLSAID